MSAQALIYISLGFFAASLMAIILSKFVFRSAYKKAAKQYRGQIPVNQAQMNAERDRLRAEFAVNLNKLEYKVAAMQQSELSLKIEATKATEHKQRMTESLNSYIKKAVRWEVAHEHSQSIINVLKQKLQSQTHDEDTSNLDVENAALKNELVIQATELEAAKKNNIIYEAKISEISTQMLFLSQELFAKKISLDLSERSIDKYKDKLLTQKLQMRDASLKDKALYAVKSKLDGTANLDLEGAKTTSKIATLPGLAATLVQKNEPPKLVHTAPKAKAATGLRDRMNSIANGTDD